MIDQRLQQAMMRRAAQITRWLADEAPYAESDQLQLQAHSPQRAYYHLGYYEQVEVASLNGDVALGPDGGREIHVHAVSWTERRECRCGSPRSCRGQADP